MVETKGMKVSAGVGLAVTLLAVTTALAFSVASVSYQREVVKLRRANAEYQETLDKYKSALEGIQSQLSQAGFKG